MNTIDFLSSDIEFPCDSNEPKLSANPCTKLPEPVDWSFHDYYSTVLEKAFSPINTITDIRSLETVKGPDVVTQPPNYLKDWKHPSLFTVHDKQDDQAVVVVLSNAIQPPQPPPSQQQNSLRAALRGALDLVENDMQKNMHESFRTPTPPSQRGNRPFGNSSVFGNKDHYLTWKDDILAETLYIGSMDQDLWDDEEDQDANALIRGDASPAYHAIDENPIIDSSLPSRISSIMPLSQTNTTTQQLVSVASPQQRQEEIEVAIVSEPSSPVPSLASPPPPASKSGKQKSWNVWTKVKQAALPFTKQFKSSTSSKKAFKRLFQH